MSDFWELNRFWIERKWPDDWDGKSFLARAVQSTGQVLFPDAWDESDVMLRSRYGFVRRFGGIDLPLSRTEAKRRELRAAHDLLNRHAPHFERGPITYRKYGYDVPPFSDAEWSAVIEISKRLDDEALQQTYRASSARKWLATMARSDALGTYLRPVNGGDYSDRLPVRMWNTERIMPRFTYCQMNPSDPYSSAVAGDRFQWIFVDESELAELHKAEAKKRGEQSEDRGPETTRGPKTYHAPDEVRAWMKQLVAKIKGTTPVVIPTLDEVWELAKDEFSNIARDRALEAWRAERKPGWEKPGPRGNSSGDPE